MSKIALLADIHLGANGRTDDILWALRVARHYCRANSIDTIVTLGDLFHDRESLKIDILNAACDFFETTHDQYGQRWLAFPGNHDMFLKHSWEINSLRVMRKYLTVINDVSKLTIDDRNFYILPFISNEKSYMRAVKLLEERHQDGDNLLTHIGVRGSTLNTCFLLKDWSYVDFSESKFRRVYTGHFHNRQQVGDNVWFPGSLIPFKFDEGDIGHGFYVLDLETDEQKFINIWKAGAKYFPDETQPPQFCTFLDSLLSEKTEADVKNNIIRVALEEDASPERKREIREYLEAMGARAVRWMNLKQPKPECELPPTVEMQKINLFRAWREADIKGTKELDPKLLDSLNAEVVAEGDIQYLAEDQDI